MALQPTTTPTGVEIVKLPPASEFSTRESEVTVDGRAFPVVGNTKKSVVDLHDGLEVYFYQTTSLRDPKYRAPNGFQWQYLDGHDIRVTDPEQQASLGLPKGGPTIHRYRLNQIRDNLNVSTALEMPVGTRGTFEGYLFQGRSSHWLLADGAAETYPPQPGGGTMYLDRLPELPAGAVVQKQNGFCWVDQKIAVPAVIGTNFGGDKILLVQSGPDSQD